MNSMSAPSRRFFHLFYEHTITACRHKPLRSRRHQRLQSSYKTSLSAEDARRLRQMLGYRPKKEAGVWRPAHEPMPYTTTSYADDATSSKVSSEPPSTHDHWLRLMKLKTATSEAVPPLPATTEERSELLDEPIRAIDSEPELPPPPTEKEIQEPLTERMRNIMRRVPHPVVVITGGHKAGREITWAGDKESKSMTVSSFNTVRLHPTPIVSFNTKVPSRTLDQIMYRGGYCFVDFLLSDGRSAALAHEFAGRIGERSGSEKYNAQLASNPDNLHRKMREAIRRNADARRGILARARCRILQDSTVTIGDHRILVAEVQDVWDASFRKSMPQTHNLVYVNGKYVGLSEQQEDLPLELPFGQEGKGIEKDPERQQALPSQTPDRRAEIPKNADVLRPDDIPKSDDKNLNRGYLRFRGELQWKD